MRHYRIEIHFCKGKICVKERSEYCWAKDKRHAENIGWMIIQKKYGSRYTGHKPHPVEIK